MFVLTVAYNLRQLIVPVAVEDVVLRILLEALPFGSVLSGLLLARLLLLLLIRLETIADVLNKAVVR